MSIKKKLGLGVASAALGLALIGGGTFAYFNDTLNHDNNSYATGTLDLQPDVNASIPWSVDNLKPGDNVARSWTVNNGGTLNAKDIEIQVASAKGATDAVDLADQLKVTKFQYHYDHDKNVATPNKIVNLLDSTTNGGVVLPATVYLDDLRGSTFKTGLVEAQTTGTFDFTVVFEETNKDQNAYQGTSQDLDIQFVATQEAGSTR